MTQLERAGINWHSIHDLFVTHTHVDHLLGSVWILRVVCYGMECGNYRGEFRFWGNGEVVAAADKLAHMLLRPSESAFIGKRVFLHAVEDGDTAQILGAPRDLPSTFARPARPSSSGSLWNIPRARCSPAAEMSR